jgi:hypothetical protein
MIFFHDSVGGKINFLSTRGACSSRTFSVVSPPAVLKIPAALLSMALALVSY